MLAPLLLALGRARQDGLGSPETLVLLAASALATAAFVVVELRTAAPMFDLRLFARRYFALSMLSSLTVFLSYYTVVFLMPFYLVQARGISPSLAGLLLSANTIAMALVASPAGVLNDRIGSILPASVGAIGIGLALLMFSRVGPDTPYAYIVAALALVGAGAGLGDVSNNAAMMGAAPPARRGMASGVIATTRYIGQSLGVAFSSFIFTLAAGAEVGSQSLPGFTAAFLGMSAFAWLSLLTSLTRGKAPPRPSAP
jgi:MFS family permease